MNVNFNNHATNTQNYNGGIDPFERYSGHVFTATGKFDLAGNVASLMRGNAECSSMAQVFPGISNWTYDQRRMTRACLAGLFANSSVRSVSALKCPAAYG